MTRYIRPQDGDSAVIYTTEGFEALTADEFRAMIAGWGDAYVARTPSGAWELFIDDELEEIPPEVTDVEAWAAERRETPPVPVASNYPGVIPPWAGG